MKITLGNGQHSVRPCEINWFPFTVICPNQNVVLICIDFKGIQFTLGCYIKLGVPPIYDMLFIF